MKATERTLQQILHSPDQYVIPLFQRYYVWHIKEWEKLWDDIVLLIEYSGDRRRHFLGSVVCVPEPHQPGIIPAYQVIDGQQRLMTLSIILCAMRDLAKENNWQQCSDEIQENYLIHKFKESRERYKIYPRLRDRKYYFALIEGHETTQSSQTEGAYVYFKNLIKNVGFCENEEAFRKLFVTITTQLDFVSITLEGENPYKIFKSLNSTGVDLEEGDLIRNYVFMSIDPSEQDNFDDNYWQPLEKHFQGVEKINDRLFAAFFRDVIMRNGEYIPPSEIYITFEKKYPLSLIDPLEMVIDLEKQAARYDIIIGKTKHPVEAINRATEAIRDLYATTSYPLVLALLELFDHDEIMLDGLLQGLNAISSFVFRRYVCGESSRAYYRWFCIACRELKDEPILNLLNYLKGKGWPDNDSFIPKFIRMNLYNSDYNFAILKRLEVGIQSESEPVGLDKCWIEHVMPQTISENEDGQDWIESLGTDWQRIHSEWLNTPGNLTLVGHDYNKQMSNKSFKIKKVILSGSRVYLNKYFADPDLVIWNENEIFNRGEEISKIAAEKWIGPTI